MKKTMSNYILHQHNTLLEKYGESPKSLGIQHGQTIKYHIASQIGISKNSTVLDVGCGFGDFFGFLKYRKIKVKYLGIDLNKNLVRIARKRYPDASFEVGDIGKKQFSKFDWVIGIGITNYASGNFNKTLVKEMFRICKKGVFIDFLTTYVDYKDKENHYKSPEKMFKFAKSLTRRVSLRHDYQPFYFCLYLYKDDTKNKKNYFRQYYQSLPKVLQEDLWLEKMATRRGT